VVQNVAKSVIWLIGG